MPGCCKHNAGRLGCWAYLRVAFNMRQGVGRGSLPAVTQRENAMEERARVSSTILPAASDTSVICCAWGRREGLGYPTQYPPRTPWHHHLWRDPLVRPADTHPTHRGDTGQWHSCLQRAIQSMIQGPVDLKQARTEWLAVPLLRLAVSLPGVSRQSKEILTVLD